MKFLNFGTKLNITPQLENLYTSLPFVVGVTKVFTCSTSVMKNVRLPLLSSWELADKVSRVEVMRKDKKCRELLEEAKNYHLMVNQQPLLQNSRTQVRADRKKVVFYLSEEPRNL